jgi:hypothetical protein
MILVFLDQLAKDLNLTRLTADPASGPPKTPILSKGAETASPFVTNRPERPVS